MTGDRGQTAAPPPPALPARRLPPAGVPAVVVLAACAALTLYVLLKPARPQVATLQARAEAAVAAGDANTALLTYQHVLALEPHEPKHAYDLARALDKLGRRSDGVAILGTVAPDAGGGYPPAHLLMAQWLIEARVLGGVADAAVVRRALRQLESATADPDLRAEATDLREIADRMLTPTTRPRAPSPDPPGRDKAAS